MSISRFVSSAKVGDKTITLETGTLAKQADGAVLVRCGEDAVLTTVVSSRTESNLDFFPMTVEYQEKFYAAGRIPGGFFRREARPSYEATLNARMIDRPIRPCFPKGYCYDTQIVATTLSYSGETPLGILASIGASAALHISDIPFKGPVASVQVVGIDGELQLNPSLETAEQASLNFTVAGTKNGLLMVEGESQFVSEEEALKALKFAHESIQPILEAQDDLRKQSGSLDKRKWTGFEVEQNLEQKIKSLVEDKIKEALKEPEKSKRYQIFDEAKEACLEQVLLEEDSESLVALKKKSTKEVIEKLKYDLARTLILDTKKRIDGRTYTDIRDISCHVGLLPRTHGSAVFTRGETQVLGTVTLGTGDDEQKIDALSGFSKKNFLLHYNFPPYCVGETGRMGGQSRREIGHGFLAEKALKVILPKHEKFPYTVRVVSEVLESNGSSSMGTVCSGCLALMDAGVPIKKPVAGIAMGLIKEDSKVAVLSDILGDEDHLGDMDFKVAGTDQGITALQMDIKTDSLSFEVIEQALTQAKEGRLHILNEMCKTLGETREDMSPYAPRIEMIQIKPEKIREVIGSGGKVINKIIEDTGVKVDIQDTGQIFIASPDKERIEKAKAQIEGICAEVEEGAIYEGKVVKIAEFGAFVELLPNTSGLLHISEISRRRIRQVTDVLNEGDMVKVKVLQVGDNGRIRLSRKVLLEEGDDDGITEDYHGNNDSGGNRREGNGRDRGRGGDRGGDRSGGRNDRGRGGDRGGSGRNDRSDRGDRGGGDRNKKRTGRFFRRD